MIKLIAAHLGWPKKADGLKVLHVVSVLGVNALKKVDFFLQDLRLCVDHAYDTGLLTGKQNKKAMF